MSGFIPVDRQTQYLLPPSVEEWLPENHLARFIVEVIEQLDLSELTRAYRGRVSRTRIEDADRRRIIRLYCSDC
jgi:transposase